VKDGILEFLADPYVPLIESKPSFGEGETVRYGGEEWIVYENIRGDVPGIRGTDKYTLIRSNERGVEIDPDAVSPEETDIVERHVYGLFIEEAEEVLEE
jgi:hypothetical protein